MSKLYVALFHAPDREGMDYPDTVDEFHRAAKAHGDQASFTSTTGGRGKWLRPTVEVSPEDGSGLTLSGDVTAEQIESGILQAGRDVEPRLTGEAEQKTDQEKQRLKQENENLRERLSEMEEKMRRMEKMMEEMSSEHKDESGTDERIEDTFERAGLDEPELDQRGSRNSEVGDK